MTVGLWEEDGAGELPDAHLVVVLELALIVVVLLDSVVREVDQRVEVLQRVFRAIGAHITLLEEVGAHDSVQCGYEALDANVELTVLDEQRTLNLLLDDPTVVLVAGSCLFPDGLQVIEHLDALALVAVLARLHYPHLLLALLELLLEFRPLVDQRVCVVDVEGQWEGTVLEVKAVVALVGGEVAVESLLGTDLLIVLDVVEDGLLEPAVVL